ncbi:hypothetical protein EDD21DRAFT_415772 [Dissophora ornata]|nr:hypothetical protein EDD21DRAFT_415772 [Dissophora ornata]
MSSLAPLELPEILICIAAFLQRSDCTRCCRVDKTWYFTFLPHIWSTIELDCYRFSAINPQSKIPTAAALAILANFTPHRHLVKVLKAHSNQIIPEYLAMHYPNLETLLLSSSHGVDMNFISLHRSSLSQLKIVETDLRLCISRQGQRGTMDMFWETLLGFPRLKSLSLRKCVVPKSGIEGFLRLCSTRLEQLYLEQVEFDGSPALTKYCSADQSYFTPSKLKTLSLIKVKCLSTAEQLAWILHFPGLKSLEWVTVIHQTDNQNVQSFAKHASAGRWQDLESLRIDIAGEKTASDGDLATILGSMRKLASLRLVNIGFGPRSVVELERLASSSSSLRHMSTVEVLDLKCCLAITGTTIQALLESCTQLRELACGTVLARDFWSGKPWVCKQTMRNLTICFDFTPQPPAATVLDDTVTDANVSGCCDLVVAENTNAPVDLDNSYDYNALQRLIFLRLSVLRQLSTLDISYSSEDGRLYHALDLRLTQGMGCLSHLKKLIRVNHLNTEQRMGVEEVKWISDHWKTLLIMQGIPSRDHGVTARLRAVLSKRRDRCNEV